MITKKIGLLANALNSRRVMNQVSFNGVSIEDRLKFYA